MPIGGALLHLILECSNKLTVQSNIIYAYSRNVPDQLTPNAPSDFLVMRRPNIFLQCTPSFASERNGVYVFINLLKLRFN